MALSVCSCVQDLEELLNRVNSAESALDIEESGAAIIQQIQRARERRSQITSEEMKAVIEERDTALSRVRPYYTHPCTPAHAHTIIHTPTRVNPNTHRPKHSTYSSCVPSQTPSHHQKKSNTTL